MQGPLAIASYVFDENSPDRFARILQALPYPRSPAKVRVAWSEEEQSQERPLLLDAVRRTFGSTVTEDTHVCNDTVYVTYGGNPSKALPSSNISVNTIGAFPGPPVVEVAWSTDRTDRDIGCDDVVEHYRHLATASRCRCSTLGVEQSILRIDGQIIFPVAYACAITCGRSFARDGDANYGSTVEQIRSSVKMIAHYPCKID